MFGQSYEKYSRMLLKIEKVCLYKCLKFFNKNTDIIRLNENKSKRHNKIHLKYLQNLWFI